MHPSALSCTSSSSSSSACHRRQQQRQPQLSSSSSPSLAPARRPPLPPLQRPLSKRSNGTPRCASAAQLVCAAAVSPSSSSSSSPSLARLPRRGTAQVRRAGPVDAAPAWTLDQIAGLAFGGLMAAFYLSSQQVDAFVARQQRRQLGLCEACGGANDAGSCAQKDCPMRGRAAAAAAAGAAAAPAGQQQKQQEQPPPPPPPAT